MMQHNATRNLRRENDMMKKIKLLWCVGLSAIMPGVYAATQAERIAELEYIALYEPSDWIGRGVCPHS